MKDDTNNKLGNLTPEEYHTTQENGTDAPFTGRFLHNKETGTYHCVVCGSLLFDSSTKYESGSGWPSFYELAEEGAVKIVKDDSLGMSRDEVRCATCDAHLGHLFLDGPEETTGLRYCINSTGLDFKPSKDS